MCPACIATLTLVASSATSAGGVTAIILKKFSRKKVAEKIPAPTQTKEKHDGR